MKNGEVRRSARSGGRLRQPPFFIIFFVLENRFFMFLISYLNLKLKHFLFLLLIIFLGLEVSAILDFFKLMRIVQKMKNGKIKQLTLRDQKKLFERIRLIKFWSPMGPGNILWGPGTNGEKKLGPACPCPFFSPGAPNYIPRGSKI